MNCRKVSLVVLVLLMSLTSITAYALDDGLKVNVHAKAIDADGDSVRNDIAVLGVMIVSGAEGTIKVDVIIELVGPEGPPGTQEFSLICEARSTRNTLLKYETVFSDFASVKGMYYVTVTATCGDITTLASFKFDPPGGSGGCPQY
ncbi:MAG: hypothetical protein NWE89_05215 [Candidatus Bathyarchaeota archaeon]|nr:hypothetical protein [Candidatus Bathyarchaeota archaeon]